jgi:hypothetical protein
MARRDKARAINEKLPLSFIFTEIMGLGLTLPQAATHTSQFGRPSVQKSAGEFLSYFGPSALRSHMPGATYGVAIGWYGGAPLALGGGTRQTTK